MSDYNASIVIDEVIDALAAFLQPFMQGGEVTRAQVNRVPQPMIPCAVLTELLHVDIDLPYIDYSATQATINGPTRIDVQIDIYGEMAGEICKAIQMAFRSSWAFDQFPQNIRPLYTSDGIQAPLVGGEQQYTSRWTITSSLQYNPVVTVPQQTANQSSVGIIQADI